MSNIGTIAQIFGPVVDVRFEPGNLPNIFNAVAVNDAQIAKSLPGEVVGEVRSKCTGAANRNQRL